MDTLRIFTIENGRPTTGALVEEFSLASGTKIPAVVVGELGRGREAGVLPVFGAEPGEIVCAGQVGKTASGRPKLLVASESTTLDACLVVFRTDTGFRGGNRHTGDRTGKWRCESWSCEHEFESEIRPTKCPKCERSWPYPLYREFPGERLVVGRIAQGTAGRMGSGEQSVAVMPRAVVFRTGYTGRLYGAPNEHFYVFDGEKIVAATLEERELADLF